MFIEPAFPVSSPTVPSGPDWRHQPKLDGWRVRLRRVGRDVRIFSRNGREQTECLSALVAALRAVTVSAVLDAELARVTQEGRLEFVRGMSAVRPGEAHRLKVWVFPSLRVRGGDVRPS